MNGEVNIRRAQLSDATAIYNLYRKVAEDPQGIIRGKPEITSEYVYDFMSRSMKSGLILVMEQGELMGEIHAYRYGIEALNHNLGDLTIVMDPNYQGKGHGKQLFMAFLQEVRQSFSDILRVELITREQNLRTRSFYSSLGFKEEGKMPNRILNHLGKMETPLLMAWMNPSFKR